MTRVYVRPQMTRIYIYQVMTGVYVFLFFLYFKKDDSCLCTSTNDSYLYISSDDWCLWTGVYVKFFASQFRRGLSGGPALKYF